MVSLVFYRAESVVGLASPQRQSLLRKLDSGVSIEEQERVRSRVDASINSFCQDPPKL
jgi:hypothetical protein